MKSASSGDSFYPFFFSYLFCLLGDCPPALIRVGIVVFSTHPQYEILEVIIDLGPIVIGFYADVMR